jgi:hypothetical protein
MEALKFLAGAFGFAVAFAAVVTFLVGLAIEPLERMRLRMVGARARSGQGCFCVSSAGPMVLHAPSVWESLRQAQGRLFGELRINCGRCRHK